VGNRILKPKFLLIAAKKYGIKSDPRQFLAKHRLAENPLGIFPGDLIAITWCCLGL
jgi:hypothetical protein